MASSAFKLIISKTRAKNFTCLSQHVITCNRYFCSKNDNEIKDLKPDLESSSSAENKQKEELSQPTSVKSEQPRTKISKPVFSEEAKEAAKKRLEALLSDIKVEPNVFQTSTPALNLARPLKRPSKKERFPPVEKISPDHEIKVAVKAVASTLDGDPEKIETELNTKLSSIDLTIDSEFKEYSAEETSDHLINTDMSKNIMSSVKDIAAEVSEIPTTPKSKLIRKLKELSADKKVPSEKDSVFNLIETMKIQVHEQAKHKMVSDEREVPRKPVHAPSRFPVKKIDLFGFPTLDIFTADTKSQPESESILWQTLKAKELKLLVQYAPASAFEEMIMWTEQGKHWKLPIDNEIDVGPEENVGFNEHVFLERHLTGFPTKGPIRHFMELVAVGLSKNPYISVDRKIENINWFRDYFKDKEEILRDSGAIS